MSSARPWPLCWTLAKRRRLSRDRVDLIVSAVAGDWAFHASDRFVSVDPTLDNPTEEYDPHANKTVVAVGADCWVVLGYTGLAFLDGKPTDQLIAEAISGYDDARNAHVLVAATEPALSGDS